MAFLFFLLKFNKLVFMIIEIWLKRILVHIKWKSRKSPFSLLPTKVTL